MGVLFVKCHASGEVVCEVCVVQCHAIVAVVIGVHILLSLPSYNFTFPLYVSILLVVQFIQLFTRGHFSHIFSLYSHGILGVVFTPPSVTVDRRQL